MTKKINFDEILSTATMTMQEADKLLDINKSRAMRRFIQRETAQGVAYQHFCYDEISSAELDLVGKLAKRTHIENMQVFLQGAPVTFQRTFINQEFGIVQNSYAINIDINTASLKELRSVVMVIRSLCERLESNIWSFGICGEFLFANPEGEPAPEAANEPSMTPVARAA